MAGKPDGRVPKSQKNGLNRRCQRVSVRVRGIVQGVGFRPTVFKLATEHDLNGWVRNQSDGVLMEVEGEAESIGRFLRDLHVKAPPLARIVQIHVEELTYQSLPAFHIVASRSADSRRTLISPDVCVCDDCLSEMLDPEDRRFRYPFINCTNCGPRYTIIKDIPYDRDKTTMAEFTMCEACSTEYHDPRDRRFHAQPNACWECGPQMWLESPDGRCLANADDAVRETIHRLSQGAIVAVKGLGGFHLAALATDERAVACLRSRKIREEKPFAVMFKDLADIEPHCHVNTKEKALLQSRERPIVLLRRRPTSADPPIAASVAPGNRHLGCFLPYTPLHRLLFEDAPYRALVMTSGNQSDEPIVTTNDDARERLAGIADFFLCHDRVIHIRCDDSVVRVVNGEPQPVRRARGYVPVPVFLPESVPPVLALGAELKNTICFTRGREAFLSQHIGDLENLETLRAFEFTIEHLQQILDIRPQLLVHDMHPDYLNTQWAERQTQWPQLAVQHHHAHIAAVMAEQGITEPVLGLALDGTGFGPDGTIWGGELLRVEADATVFKRKARLQHFLLPGGSKAIKEPWRMALSVLWCLNPNETEAEFSDLLERWPATERKVLLQMLRRGFNCPVTSSCGRLFDAVSSLAGVRDRVTYEGQAAIELEQAMEAGGEAYRGALRRDGGLWVVETAPMIREVIRDVRNRVSAGIVSARFHNGLVRLLADLLRAVSRETGIEHIVLSGGVFQNVYLSERLIDLLQAGGFDVSVHRQVPPNDACIALGQAWIGAKYLQKIGTGS